MMIRYIITLLTLTVTFHVGYSQERKSKESTLDPEYVWDYKHLLTVRSYLLYEGIGLKIKPTGISQGISYLPNIHTKVGVAAFYKWFGLGLAVRNPFYVEDNDIKGDTRIIDFRINAYGKSIAAEISYQDYNGFYLSNTDQIFSGWKHGESYYQRPDMNIDAIGVILYYLLNSDKHSIRAAYIQTEQQKKSSGALVLAPSILFTRLNADSSLIPTEYHNQFPSVLLEENVVKGDFYNAGFSIGYSYTFVFLKNFYVNMCFIPGAFLQSYNYETRTTSRTDRDFALLWLGRAAMGYNSRYFYAGAGGVFGYNSTPLPIGSTNFNFDLNQIRIWIGTRFGIKGNRK